jgi:tripartite-type tricarboxylate transporter receptor subunit TctC
MIDRIDRRKILQLGGATAASVGLRPRSAQAQAAYPSRPVTLVVPSPAGGPYDGVGRPLAKMLGEALGQTVVVENRPGAEFSLGAAFVARSSPDGYTLLLGGSPTHVFTPGLMDKPPYDPMKDFIQIGVTGTQPYSITVGAGSPAKTLQDLVAMAKASPGKLNYAATVSAARVAAELFKKKAGGLDIVPVPYRGAAPAIQDVRSGLIQMYPGVAGSVVGLHKQGVFRILAVLDDKRLPMIPDVPTAAEAGVPGVTLVTFNVVSVPAGTPSAIVDALGKALHKVVNDQTFIDIQFAMGIVTIRDSTPDSAEAFVKQQIELLHPYLQALPKN